MKKFLKSCLCLLAVLSCGLLFAGCNEDKNPPAKQDVTVNATVSTTTATAFGKFPELSATATAGGTNVAGTIVWDAGQTLTVNKTLYNWTFTPTNTSKYNVKKGSTTLEVSKATPVPETETFSFDVSENFADQKIDFYVGTKKIEGSFAFDSSVTFDITDVGTPKQVNFTFTPTDTVNCNAITNGTISVTAKVKPHFAGYTFAGGRLLSEIENIENNLETCFKVNSLSDQVVAGTCRITEENLALGKNTLHFTFTPTDGDRYLEVKGEISYVTFNTDADSDSTYLVENLDQLAAISGKLDSANFKLVSNLTVSAEAAENLPVAAADATHRVLSAGVFAGEFDGDGHSITIAVPNDGGRIAVFENISGGSKISNLTIAGDGEVVLAANVSGSAITEIKNITTSGNVTSASDAYAPLISSVTGSASLSIAGCINSTNISGFGAVSAFVGTVSGATMVMFNDCTNNGTIFGESAAMFVAVSNEDSINAQTCKTTATITATKKLSLFGNESVDPDNLGGAVDKLEGAEEFLKLLPETGTLSLSKNGMLVSGIPTNVDKIVVVVSFYITKVGTTETKKISAIMSEQTVDEESIISGIKVSNIVLIETQTVPDPEEPSATITAKNIKKVNGGNPNGEVLTCSEGTYVFDANNAFGLASGWNLSESQSPYVTVLFASGENIVASSVATNLEK